MPRERETEGNGNRQRATGSGQQQRRAAAAAGGRRLWAANVQQSRRTSGEQAANTASVSGELTLLTSSKPHRGQNSDWCENILPPTLETSAPRRLAADDYSTTRLSSSAGPLCATPRPPRSSPGHAPIHVHVRIHGLASHHTTAAVECAR